MVLLDVVYNHFGPDGNYLHAYASRFFNASVPARPGARRSTSTAPHSRTVRDFFIHNALYWIEEFHLDGLRLDAVHAMHDRSRAALRRRTRAARCAPARGASARCTWCSRTTTTRRAAWRATPTAGRARRRAVERRRAPRAARAGHRRDRRLLRRLRGRAAAPSRPRARRRLRLPGRALALPRTAQPRGTRVGAAAAAGVRQLAADPRPGRQPRVRRAHRARWRPVPAREAALRALRRLLLLAPSPPMLFMGEEYAAATPFLFFCDFDRRPRAAVTRRAARRVRPLRALRRPGGARPHPGPERRTHLHRQQARLARARTRAARRAGSRCYPDCSRCRHARPGALAGRRAQRPLHAAGARHAAHQLAARRRRAAGICAPRLDDAAGHPATRRPDAASSAATPCRPSCRAWSVASDGRGAMSTPTEAPPHRAAPRPPDAAPARSCRARPTACSCTATSASPTRRRWCPTWAALGISHLYCSPPLRARPGSQHGYDVVDHGALNPELGTRADFDALVGALHAHGMGLLVDIVPNHMGVLGGDNAWWLDVLENGAASAYAEYFDIDWHSRRPGAGRQGAAADPRRPVRRRARARRAAARLRRGARLLHAQLLRTPPAGRPGRLRRAAPPRAAAAAPASTLACRDDAADRGRPASTQLPPHDGRDRGGRGRAASATRRALKARLARPCRAPAGAGRRDRRGGRGDERPRRRARQLRRAARADRRAALPPGALARGGRRDQLPALLRHQRAGRAAHGTPRGVRGHAPPGARPGRGRRRSTACASTTPTAWPTRRATSSDCNALRRTGGPAGAGAGDRRPRARDAALRGGREDRRAARAGAARLGGARHHRLPVRQRRQRRC